MEFRDICHVKSIELGGRFKQGVPERQRAKSIKFDELLDW